MEQLQLDEKISQITNIENYDNKYYREQVLKLQFDEKLIAVCKLVKHWLKDKYDCVDANTGREGRGKTTLGIEKGYLIDKRFDLKKNIGYLPSSAEITREFNRIDTYGYYLIDEAIKALYKMNFQSKVQQIVIKMYATERKQFKATGLNMPRFRDFTENFRNWRVNLWTQVIYRDDQKGIAVVHKRDDDQYEEDPWHFKDALKVKEKSFSMKRRFFELSIEDQIKFHRKLKTYLCWFEFPSLPQEVEVAYLHLSNQYRVINGELETGEAGNAPIIKIRKEQLVLIKELIKQGYSKSKIASLLGKDHSYLNYYKRFEPALFDKKKLNDDKEMGILSSMG